MSTFKELFNSRLIDVTKEGTTTKETYHITDESDPEAVTGVPVVGSAHPRIVGIFLKSSKIKPVEALNTLSLVLTYGPPASSNAQSNANGEVWEWNQVAQTTRQNLYEASTFIVRVKVRKILVRRSAKRRRRRKWSS